VPILCLEGPSAVGKTTATRALAASAGAAVVPETGELFAVPADATPAWFLERAADRWRHAAALARDHALVVLDGDPFKALWWGWLYPGEGWTTPDEAAAFYRPRLARGALAFPHAYAYLDADEPALRARRAGDPTRRRRNFERHLRLVTPLRRYFAALGALAPGRVAVVRAGSPDAAADAARVLVERVAGAEPPGVELLDAVVEWLRTHNA
jgi:hypothetical protein